LPSEFQSRAIEAIRRTGGEAHWRPGGYWHGADGTKLEVDPVGQSASGIVGTQTIRALERQGILRRAWTEDREWCDNRVLSECDCERPIVKGGAALFSNACPFHGLKKH